MSCSRQGTHQAYLCPGPLESLRWGHATDNDSLEHRWLEFAETVCNSWSRRMAGAALAEGPKKALEGGHPKLVTSNSGSRFDINTGISSTRHPRP
jgi:hypothetical protein